MSLSACEMGSEEDRSEKAGREVLAKDNSSTDCLRPWTFLDFLVRIRLVSWVPMLCGPIWSQEANGN